MNSKKYESLCGPTYFKTSLFPLWTYNKKVPPWGLSTLAKEFTAAARIMQTSSNELSTLVSGKV